MLLSDAIDYIVTAKKAQGLAERTRRDYRSVLGRFSKHINQDMDTWTRADIYQYVASLRDNGWADATVARHIRYLRSFWGWCYREGYLSEDYALIIPAPKKHIREEYLPTTREIAALVRATAQTRHALRNRAALLALIDTGIRRGEFTELRREWLHFTADDSDAREIVGAWIMLPGRVTKSGDSRYVFLGRTSAQVLREYLAGRDDDDPALFLSEQGGPLGGYGLADMLKRVAEHAGIDPDRVHPHLFRKVFASWWIENGGDEQRLMRIAGWSGPEMLRIYVRLGSRKALQRAHREYSPVDLVLEE